MPPNQTTDAIAKIRNAGMSFTVGMGTETVRVFIPLGERLLAVTDSAVFGIQLADQIDPGRTDPTLPQALQHHIIGHGASSAIVCKTLLTGNELFDDGYLPTGFQKGRALELALQAAEYLSAMQNARDALKEDWQHAVGAMQTTAPSTAPLLPSILNLTTRAKAFIDQAQRCFALNIQLVGLFYAKAQGNKAWRRQAEEALQARFENNAPSREFFEWAADCIEAANDWRNAGWHEKEGYKIQIVGFEIRPTKGLFAPSIEIWHPQSPLSKVDLLTFMEEQIAAAADVFEGLSALLCDANITPFGVIEFRVVEVEPERARHGVRYIYHALNWPPVSPNPPTNE